MLTSNSLRWLVVVAGAAMLLAVAAACGTETVEVPGETVVVEKEVIKTVEVPGETVVKEVVKEVQVPGETVVVKEEVVKEVMVPGETVVVEKVVTETVEVPGETVTVEVVKEVQVPGETVVVEKEVIREVMVPGETVVVEKVVIATPEPVAPPALEPVYTGQVLALTNSLQGERWDVAYGTNGKDIRDIYGYLVGRDIVNGKLTTVPGIAKLWELAPDGQTITYTIRRGVKFHDGTEVTAEDVAWSLQRCFGPQAPDNLWDGICINYSNNMDQVEQITIDQVRVISKVPITEMWGYGSRASGGHTIGIVYPKREQLYDKEAALAYDRNPIGAGLIKLVEHRLGESMTFERFGDYYHQPAYGFPTDHRLKFELYKSVVAPDVSTRIAATRAGEADIGRVDLGAAGQIEAGGGRIVFSPESFGFDILQWGCFDPDVQCNDRRVRQALAYAIDKELMRDELYGPEVMVVKGWTVTTPSTVGYSPEVDPFPFDPERARQLLADAGYLGGEGFGKLIVNVFDGSLPFASESAQLAAESWQQELGIDVEVKTWEGGTIWNNLMRHPRDYNGQIMWQSNNGRTDASGTNKFWYMSQNVTDEPDPPGQWLVHNDPELVALGQQALAQIGREGEQEAMNTWYRRLRDENYHIGVGYINDPWGVGPRIATWEPWSTADYFSALHTITLNE